MNILVTGGAGYIGSHMVRMLVAKGHTVIVLDSLEYGHKASIPSSVRLVEGNVGDVSMLEPLFSSNVFDAVIHFAAYISVAESVVDPRKYISNNIIRPVALLETMKKFGVKKFIFSSTAAVYGNPQIDPIPEDHPKNPTSPYGLTKWMFEELLRVYDRSFGIKSMCLRYFNASGASLDGFHGEDHSPETHIIPLAVRTAMGKQKEFLLYGTDYPTKDGTCIRDFIHIEDLCEAHIVGLEALERGHESNIYNVATGSGFTNREVIDTVMAVTGVDFPVREEARRPGDPHSLVANPQKIMKELGWKPKYSDIRTIVGTAWQWHKNHPSGYEDRH